LIENRANDPTQWAYSNQAFCFSYNPGGNAKDKTELSS